MKLKKGITWVLTHKEKKKAKKRKIVDMIYSNFVRWGAHRFVVTNLVKP